MAVALGCAGCASRLDGRQASTGQRWRALSGGRHTMHRKTKLLRHVLAACALVALASGSVAAQDLSLAGKTIGVAVVGTQHFWDREAFNGATKEVEALGGTVVGVDGG